jgi:hypothetical protein
LEIFANKIIEAKIKLHKIIISKKANIGECRPKKIIDQQVFKTSCPTKTAKAILTSQRFNPARQIKKAEIPIKVKSVVQTGAKIQFGGEKTGLANPAYQVAIDGVVKTEPTIPATWQIKIAKIAFETLLIFIFFKINSPILILRPFALNNKNEPFKRIVFVVWGQALSGLITVLEDKEYMVTLREKMNNIKKVAKFYNYDLLLAKK